MTKPLDEEYHSWACAVVYHDDPRKAEVTFFFDDVEVGCHVLHARHEDMKTKVEFFPMANVAVKANPPGLLPGTTYHYRVLMGGITGGGIPGEDMTFTIQARSATTKA